MNIILRLAGVLWIVPLFQQCAMATTYIEVTGKVVVYKESASKLVLDGGRVVTFDVAFLVLEMPERVRDFRMKVAVDGLDVDTWKNAVGNHITASIRGEDYDRILALMARSDSDTSFSINSFSSLLIKNVVVTKSGND